MKTYAAIQAEIQKLERQAQAVRKAEISGVVSRIKEAIVAYGLTAEDLGFGGGRGRARAADSGRRKEVVRASKRGIAKYRDPATGKTWTGQGRPPAWILAAKDRDSMLIGPARKGAGTNGKSSAARSPKKGAGAGRRAAKAASRKAVAPSTKTPAVQIESGAASE